MKPVWLALVSLLPMWCFAADSLTLETRSRKGGDARTASVQIDPRGTAIVICDMWDQHWCKGATERVAEMAPRMNEVVNAARERGIFIIHAPSETMEFYKDTPQRKRALEAPVAKAPAEIGRWRRLEQQKEPALPIDDSDGGCDDVPQCKGGPPYPWKRQIATITIGPNDAISDNGQEVYNLLQQQSRSNVIVMGVHANMCVLGRSFAIRQMVANGKNVFLMRDMTDTMYCSRMRPFTNHFRGTDLVVQHIEKYWCPSITSTVFTGKPAFHFKDDIDIAGNDAVRDQIRRFKGRGQTVDAGAGAKPLSPQESVRHFRLAEGLKISLALAEPDVRQPVCLNFDDRGRMWVVQYLQYPFPAGLKVLKYDEHLRAVFDKVPMPPPNHVPGADKVTIYEDRDKDGYFESHKDFVTGLNIATSALKGRDGVWVMNPPYLLFYPDKDGNDEPDGPPEVRLEGFGLEDTHAVANSLAWGPDGWLYGAQGSTCTATVRGVRFLGQAIWRYRPETDEFELFAEGGGNTFCVTFDRKGRLFSGTNWGNQRGLYFVQGGYYVKAWGKHGPLTNPHAYGFFNHMPHDGDQARFSHSLVIYESDALPEKYYGKMFSIVPLQNRVQISDLISDGSSYRTRDTARAVETDDKWFRPVDIKTGPDGAIYVADWYDIRLTHVDPRDDWDRSNGRIYRLSGTTGNAKQAPSDDAAKRRWEVRLIGDKKKVSASERERLVEMARYETDAQVRSQLASSARRLPADACLAIVSELLRRDEDVKDPHIPLLLWWAIESKAVAHKAEVSRMFLEKDIWKQRIAEEHIMHRLIQRYAADGDLELVARFMATAPDNTRRGRLFTAIGEAYKGRKLDRVPQALRDEIAKVPGEVPLKLRLGLGNSQDISAGIEMAEDEAAGKAQRIEIIEALANMPEAMDALLRVAKTAKSHAVRKAALQSLQNFDEPRIARDLLVAYPQLPKEEGVRARAVDLLTRRPNWSRQLLAAIEAGQVKREDVPFDAVQRIRLHDDVAATKIWGAVRKPGEEKTRRMRELAALLSESHGDAIRGKQLFAQTCASCHKLHGEGANIGPDLTGYERDNLQFWLLAIIDPSIAIREEYTNFELETTDGLLLTGFITERGAESVTIEDGEQGRMTIPKVRIKSLKASPTSRMPEGLLDSMSEQEIQDLFAYLRSPGGLASSSPSSR
ncbi:MAG TPA: PVC-type heme-binding CxxCH protein [Verrucomicrobiae bacterium]|nr:PVC-type heme-binding CxxCH protein [Verrucomicrobiae bacterium]